MSSHCSGGRRARPTLPPVQRTRTAAKRPVSGALVPSRQLMFCQVFPGKPNASSLTLTGCLVAVRRGITGGASHALVAFGRQWRNVGRPDHHSRGDANHIQQSHVAQIPAKVVVNSVSRIGKHAMFGRALIKQLPQLLQCDLRFGGKFHFLGYASLPPAPGILSPRAGQIQLPRYRQAAIFTGQRYADGDLAVSCLPGTPQCWRATPAEWTPFLGKPVSSMIQKPPSLMPICGTTH